MVGDIHRSCFYQLMNIFRGRPARSIPVQPFPRHYPVVPNALRVDPLPFFFAPHTVHDARPAASGVRPLKGYRRHDTALLPTPSTMSQSLQWRADARIMSAHWGTLQHVQGLNGSRAACRALVRFNADLPSPRDHSTVMWPLLASLQDNWS